MNELHNMGGDTTKGGLGKNHSFSHGEEFGFPSFKLVLHVINNKLKVSIDRPGVEDGEANVFAKVGAGSDTKYSCIVIRIGPSTVPREKHFGLSQVNFLTRLLAERLKNIQDSITVVGSRMGEEGQVICKEEVRDF